MTTPTAPKLTRRALLASVSGIAAAALLAACGETAAPATTAPAASTSAASQAPASAPATGASAAPASAKPSTAASSAPSSSGAAPAASAASSPAANPFGEPKKKGGNYVFGTSGESVPRNFVGTSYYGSIAFFISKLLYTPLIWLDKDWNNPGPGLATKWEWSGDGKTLTVNLRPNVKFHDGSPLTAKDVEFTYKLMVRNDAYPAVQDITIFEGGEDYKKGTTDTFKGVEVVDDMTVRFKLTSPTSTFLRNISNCGILPAKAFSPDVLKVGDDIAKIPFFDGKAIGTGPFKIKSYDPKTALVLDANPDYYKGAPALGNITIRFGLLGPAQVAALQSGEIDSALVTLKDASILRENQALTLAINHALANELVIINATEKDFLNVKVRQAIRTAIDVDTLSKTVGYNFPKPAPSVMMHASLFPNDKLPKYDFNVDKAKALLKEGNWDASRKLKVGRWTAQGTPDDIDSALMTMWKNAGIDVEFMPMDAANQVKISKENPHPYDIAITGFAWLAYDPSSAYTSFACERRPNYSNYCNPDFDSAMKEAIRSTDEKAATAAYQKAQTILTTELPYTPVWIEPEIFAISKKVHGGVLGRGPLNDIQSELWWKE